MYWALFLTLGRQSISGQKWTLSRIKTFRKAVTGVPNSGSIGQNGHVLVCDISISVQIAHK